MKRRAKKYNKNKWLIHQVNHVLDNWAVGFLAGIGIVCGVIWR